MNAHRTISEAAARTGFTASALRFYESAGLVTPARTAAGYRTYDDHSIDRLRFIARAKHLGLSLGEITELVQLWDGDRCAPVAGRLHALIGEKIRESETRVAELIAFIADLERFRTSLAAREPTVGPCDDACACVGSPRTSTTVARIAKTDAVTELPPIACTLDPGAMFARRTDWQQLVAAADHAPISVDGGVTVRFPSDAALAGRVAALAAAEQSCCSFLTFTVRFDHTGTDLTVTAPAEASTLVEALFGVPA
jgi:MerR family transcriptional regulator, copper efflux regulator